MKIRATSLVITILFAGNLLMARQSQNPQYNEWFHKANTAQFNFQDSLALQYYHQAFQHDQKEPNGLWSVALIYGKFNHADSAMHYLEKAVDAGWNKLEWIERNADLKVAMEAHPKRWKSIIQPMKEAERAQLKEKGYHVDAYYQLDSLAKLDFAVREKIYQAMNGADQEEIDRLDQLIFAQDSANLQALKAIIRELGDIPTFQTVGKKGEGNAFVLVQHASQDTLFQEEYLEKMKAHGKEKVALQSIAYLTDRVMIRKEGMQLYGTQVDMENRRIFPIKDPNGFSARLKAYDMGTLEEFKQYCEINGVQLPEGLE